MALTGKWRILLLMRERERDSDQVLTPCKDFQQDINHSTYKTYIRSSMNV